VAGEFFLYKDLTCVEGDGTYRSCIYLYVCVEISVRRTRIKLSSVKSALGERALNIL